MKRHGPEEPEADAGPLFATRTDEARIDRDSERARAKAGKLDPAWQRAALGRILEHAQANEYVIVEDVSQSFGVPPGADARAWGQVVRTARSAGILEAGDAVRDRWGSWKTRWRSRVWRS